jgi:hypothetical protein
MYDFENFEWDAAKFAANLVKHGFNFRDAIQVFEDVEEVTTESFKNGELRYKTVGICEGSLVAVIHTPRGSNCRIISMRHVRNNERRAYYGNS